MASMLATLAGKLFGGNSNPDDAGQNAGNATSGRVLQGQEKTQDPNDMGERKTLESTGTADEEEVKRWLGDKWAKIMTAYLTYHQLIWQAILFYVNQTWITWDPYRKIYYPSEPEDEYTPQPRINKFSPTIDAVAANFNQLPVIEAMGVEADGDLYYKRHGIAVVATKLAKDFMRRQGLKSDFNNKPNKPTKAAMDFVISGGLYTYIRKEQKQRQTPLGPQTYWDVDMELVSALEILPRPGSQNFGTRSGTPYWFVARRMTVDEAWNRFQVECSADMQFLDSYNSTYENALNYYYTGFNAIDIQNEDSCLVVECFVPPHSDNSPGVKEFWNTGLYAIWANQALKRYDDWDSQFPELPITKFDYISVPKMFFGRSIAFDLVDLQEELQEYEAIIKLHAMCNAVSPWVVDANTLVSEITGRADKVIKYRSLGPQSVAPKREQPGTLDQGVYAKRQQLVADFEAVSGAALTMRGQNAGHDLAASTLAQMRGQAEQLFSGPQMNWNNGWKETVRKAVKFMQTCYTFDQVVSICGGTSPQAVRDFLESEDLDADIQWTSTAHGTPQSQDELKQEMMMLFDKGALDMTQVEVRERVFQLFGETGMLTMFNLDATRARMENRAMKMVANPITGQGGPTPPTFMPEIEDLNTHYLIHSEAIKSLEFDSLPIANKQMLIQHTLATKAAMQMMAAGSSSLPGAPTAPPPGQQPPPGGPSQHTGAHPASQNKGAAAHSHTGAAELPSQGRAATPTSVHGQGIQPIGASHGAPPNQPQPAHSNPLGSGLGLR